VAGCVPSHLLVLLLHRALSTHLMQPVPPPQDHTSIAATAETSINITSSNPAMHFSSGAIPTAGVPLEEENNSPDFQRQEDQERSLTRDEMIIDGSPSSSPSSMTDREGDSSFKLFVGQIPRNLDDQSLAPYFTAYGDVAEVFVVRDKATGVSKGCCFVRYRRKSACERCIEFLNDKVTLEGSLNALQVSYARSVGGETKLLVGQLPPTTEEAELTQLFESFGASFVSLLVNLG